MDCEKIKGLILLDYSDDRVDDRNRKRIEEHLARCVSCRAFAQAVEELAIRPFAAIEPESPPESLWQKIDAEITMDELSQAADIRRPLPFIAGLTAFMRSPRPLAVALSLLLIITAAITARVAFAPRPNVNEYLEQQISFISGLEDKGTGFLDNGEPDLGTTIEEYFL